MSCNVGGIDRTIRITLGIVLLLVGYLAVLPPWGTVAAYIVGAIALATGTIRFCPLWAALGITTCEPKTATKA